MAEQLEKTGISYTPKNAGVLIVEEAGGRVTDFDGQPLDFAGGVERAANRGIVAGTITTHEQAIRALSTDAKAT
ncbi:hypothetical protein ICT70_09205 [Pelobacter sp. M08fum]|uniref:Uncharacterized protein n=1 Tax=Pelovirga terrestris TaxID=2771352 RepID=A0A8J6UL96_9BACT|nr:hypothetical protein [Pelovirga terrestris]